MAVAPLVSAPGGPDLLVQGIEERVLVGANACFARWGLTKTTLDDIAREARCSRATVYRVFPGGKSSLIEAVAQREVARLLFAADAGATAADSLEDVLVEMIVTAGRFLAGHETLGYLLRHEPESVAPYLAFDRVGPLLGAASTALAPSLERFVPRAVAEEAVEWAARVVLSYTFIPSRTVDLCSVEHVSSLVRSFFMVGLSVDAARSTVSVGTSEADRTTPDASKTRL